MIGPGTGVRVYLACSPTDMRKGIAGLAAAAQEVLRQDPCSGAVFAFRGRQGDRLKLLTWDGQGFCLYYKVLERGRLTNRVLDLVAHNIDVALRMGVDDAQTMVHRRVARFAYGLFASPAYLAKIGGIAGTDEVADFIAPPKAVRDYLASSVFNGVALPAVDVEANNYLLIRDLAVAGRGVGLMPAAVCASDVAKARLRPVLPDLIAGEVAMVLSFPARADISGRVRDFADHLARHLAV